MSARTLDRPAASRRSVSTAAFAVARRREDTTNNEIARLAAGTGHDFLKVTTHRPQAKLTVNQPGDAHEQEADAVADRVMRAEADEDKELAPTVQTAVQRDDLPGSSDATPLSGGGNSGSTTIQFPPTMTTYDVGGNTLADVSANLPPDEAGNAHFGIGVASTTGDPITSAAVNVTHSVEMPRWTERDRQCPAVKNAWDNFLAALRNHEMGHIAISRQRLAQAHTRFTGLHPGDVQDRVTLLTNETQAAYDAYDASNGHGLTQSPPTILDTTPTCPPATTSNDAGATDLAGDTATALAKRLPGELSPANESTMRVSVPGEPLEEEADAMADRVMRAEADEDKDEIQHGPQDDLQRKCAACEEEETARTVAARQATVPGVEEGADVSHVVRDGLSGGGQPLDSGTRSFMESRFGHDFGAVRIHTDGRAADSAQAVNARAYTVGSDIAFGHGEYNPGTSSGKHLLAHELTHTIQQGTTAPRARRTISDRMASQRYAPSLQRKISVNRPGDTFEAEADRAANLVTRTDSPLPLPGSLERIEDTIAGRPQATAARQVQRDGPTPAPAGGVSAPPPPPPGTPAAAAPPQKFDDGLVGINIKSWTLAEQTGKILEPLKVETNVNLATIPIPELGATFGLKFHGSFGTKLTASYGPIRFENLNIRMTKMTAIAIGAGAFFGVETVGFLGPAALMPLLLAVKEGYAIGEGQLIAPAEARASISADAGIDASVDLVGSDKLSLARTGFHITGSLDAYLKGNADGRTQIILDNGHFGFKKAAVLSAMAGLDLNLSASLEASILFGLLKGRLKKNWNFPATWDGGGQKILGDETLAYDFPSFKDEDKIVTIQESTIRNVMNFFQNLMSSAKSDGELKDKEKLTGAGGPDPRTPEQKQDAVDKAATESDALLSAADATPASVSAQLPAIQHKYRLTSLLLQTAEGDLYYVEAIINPIATTKPHALKPSPPGTGPIGPARTSIRVGDWIARKTTIAKGNRRGGTQGNVAGDQWKAFQVADLTETVITLKSADSGASMPFDLKTVEDSLQSGGDFKRINGPEDVKESGVYVENGMLKKEFQGSASIRSAFYFGDYTKNSPTNLPNLRSAAKARPEYSSGDPNNGGTAWSPNAWLCPGGFSTYPGAHITEKTAEVDHIQSIADHWNSGGNNTDQGDRRTWNETTPKQYLCGTCNSDKDRSKNYTATVGDDFTGGPDDRR